MLKYQAEWARGFNEAKHLRKLETGREQKRRQREREKSVKDEENIISVNNKCQRKTSHIQNNVSLKSVLNAKRNVIFVILERCIVRHMTHLFINMEINQFVQIALIQ